MKHMIQNTRAGLVLSTASAVISLIGAAAYTVSYLAFSAGEVDRVFSLLTLGLMIAGALVILAGDRLRFTVTPVLAGVCFGIGLANHMVKMAYPLADLFTGVRFYGGNPKLAISFFVVFLLATILNTAGSFLPHRT